MYMYSRPTEDKIFAILSHIFGINIIVPLIIYFMNKEEYVRKHAKDAIIFNIIILISIVIFKTISGILGFVTFGFFDYISGFMYGIGSILYFLLVVYGCWQIWNDKHFSYPYLIKLERYFPLKR